MLSPKEDHMINRRLSALVAVGLASALAANCAKKKSSSSDSASSTTASTGSTSSTTSTTGTLNLAVSDASGSSSLVDANGLELDSSAATVSCAVPGSNAASGCSVQGDATTGQAKIPSSCLTAAGTTCQISSGGTVIANVPLDISTSSGAPILNIDSDTSTGSTNVQQVDSSGNSVSAPTPQVPDALKNLKITSGIYSMTVCKGVAKDANGNVFPDFNSCGTKSGFTQSNYVNFTQGTASVYPVLEVWRSLDAYNSCVVSGQIKYALSDGTNTFNPSLDGSQQFDALGLRDAMVANKWVPAGAKLRYAFSDPSLAPASTGGDDQKMKEAVNKIYAGKSDVCAALATDLAAAWDKATLSMAKGVPTCSNVSLSTSDSAINTAFSTSPDMLQKCGRYKSKKGGYTQAKFQAECASFLAGKAGQQEKTQSDLQLVDAFLQSVSQLRHSTGDDRMAPLKTAFAALPKDLSTITTTSTDYEGQLVAFLKLWSGLTWDPKVTKLAPDLIANFNTALVADSKKPWIESSMVGQTGRQVLVGWMQKNKSAGGYADLIDSQICMAGSNSLDVLSAAFRKVAANSYTDLTNLYGDFSFKGPQPSWKSGVTASTICGHLNAVYADALALTDIPHCSQVVITSMKQQVASTCQDQTNNSWIGGAVDAAIYGKKLGDAATTLQNLSSFTLNSSTGLYSKSASASTTADADYAKLIAAVKDVAATGRGAYMTQMLQNVDGGKSGSDGYAKLYRLVQNFTDAFSRDSFDSDTDYRNKLVTIQQKSTCPFDAVLLHDPVLDSSGSPTFKAVVRSPVYRQFSAPVRMSPNSSSSTPLFEAVDQKLQSGGDCTWGHKQDMNNISVPDSSGTFTMSSQEVFLQCNQGSNASAPTPFVSFIKAALQSN